MALSAIERIRLDKAAVDEGFGLKRPDDGDWLAYDTLGVPASIRLTCVGQDFVVAINHRGVARDLADRWSPWLADAGPAVPEGFRAFIVVDTAPLHHLVREMWRLVRALPAAPLHAFEQQTRTLPRSTEAERLVVLRVGQNVFREALMTYWDGRCAVTGVAEPSLLRASHVRPWSLCETDAERLDVYNGLLLAAHLDAAFDGGLVSFAADGLIMFSERFRIEDRGLLGLRSDMRLRHLVPDLAGRLAWHRENLFR